MYRPLSFVAIVSFFVACGSSPPAEQEPRGPALVTVSSGDGVESVATPAADVMREGTVVFEEIPPTKSVRAYTGAELFLDTGGERITLRPTEAVSRERLIALAGRDVRVRVVWTKGHPPARGASAPLGMDGEPLPQGAGWRVLAVEER